MKRKILFVIPYLYEGGAQRFLSNLQMNLPEDWEIETLVNSEYNKAYEFRGRIHSLGIETLPRTSSVFFQFKVFLKRVQRLKKLKKTGKYVACISIIDSANVSNILSGNKTCKTIISVVTSLLSINNVPQYRYIVNPLARLLYKKADKVVAVSEELKCELIKTLKLDERTVYAITTGCDLEMITKMKKEPVEDSIYNRIKGNRVICNVGRLSFPKGQWHLIRAFKIVKESIPDVVLVIAGEGELEDYLKGITREMGLSDSVIMLGHTDNVYKYLNVSDVFVFPSLLEGFPNALAEAICVGVPCVATDFKTGAREMIAPDLLFTDCSIDSVTECEYGILTPVCSGKMYEGKDPIEDSEKLLAAAIIRMLDPQVTEDYIIRIKSKAESLDNDHTVQKWIDVIENGA